jgi:membrane protein YqaA with SNARE-associated domain
LQTIKHIVRRYTRWIWGWLGPLGPWGVFTFAAVDASLMGLPLDAVVASYVYNDRPHFWFYVLLAAAGSAVGSSALYLIGYAGGEALLRKRLPPARYDKIHASFENHEFWALMLPAMLPPPTPFKLFVLAAAGFEMRFPNFLLAIFAGRCVRFLLLALLTIRFGPQFVHLIGDVFRQHFRWLLIAVAITLLIWLEWRRRKGRAVL